MKSTVTIRFNNVIKKTLIIAAFFLPGISQAQLQIKGITKMENGESLPFASVLLLNSSDSSLVRGQLSNDAGFFTIDVSEEGFYFISVSAVGYHKETTKVFQVNKSNSPVNIGSITVHANFKLLSEVIVTAEKPMFEQKIDRTIINVHRSISKAGGTALDILQRSPGVSVDKMNNAISLSGKQGVRIMINGKISRLPMEAIVQMLGGMNAENIERIELITTPPSKYDAEGDAGMINIVMKQMEDTGTNGNLSLFSGYGRRSKYGGTLNFNSRSKKLNLFGDITTRNDYTRQYFNTRWSIPINNQMNETISINNRKAFTGINTGGLGFDWSVGKKTTIGSLFNFFDRKWDMDALADITRTIDQNLSYSVSMNSTEQNDWLQLLGNLNLKHDFNNNFSMSVDLDRINYNSTNPTDYYQDYFDNQGNNTTQEVLRSRKDTGIDIFTSAIDFTSKINEKIILEFGSKGSFTTLDNDIVVDQLNRGTWSIDDGLTSYANMYENITAGYASTTIKATSKLDIQAGIRYEHTRTNIDIRTQKDLVDRKYGKWFPSLFINHKINDNSSWVISYSRRISRPSFFQLAPFVYFNDPNNFFSGNISLWPSFTDALKAEYKFKSILLSLQYSHDKNAISLFQPSVNADNKQVSTAKNLDYQNNYSIVLSFPVQVTNWWEMQLNSMVGLYSNLASYMNNPISSSIVNFSFNGSQKFKLSKSITAELSGFYISRQLFGILEWPAYGTLDVGFEKKFSNSSLRASYTDIFGTNKWKWGGTTSGEKLTTTTYVDFETTIPTLTYTVNFGNNMLKKKRLHKTGSNEEQDRLK